MHLHWPRPLHPLLAQKTLEARARIRRWRQRPAEASFHGLAFAALALLAVLALQAAAPRVQALIALCLAHPLAAVAILTLAASGWLHRQARAFRVACFEQGWLSALPVRRQLHRQGLRQQLSIGALGLALCAAIAALALWALLPLPTGHALALLLQWLLATGLGFASILALHLRDRSLRGIAAPSTRIRESLRSQARAWPAAPRWLGPWPELGQLQRRCAQRDWRSGRAWVWLLPLGLLVLAGEAARVFAGMLLLVGLLPWLRTVLDSSARAIAEADCVLQATPRSRALFCSSAWRYPSTRAALASLAVALALGLFGASPWVVALGGLGFLLVCGLEIALMLRYPRSRARQRGQLMAETALLLVLAREGLGPGILPIALALMAWHAWRARKYA